MMQEESFGTLLELLGDGPETAGAAYRGLHRRITRFFRLNARIDPEALADEVMNRLARAAAREASAIASLEGFALGIARHVLQEDLRAQIRAAETGRTWEASRDPADPSKELILQAIETCLGNLPLPKSGLLRTYYEWTGKRKIDHHRELAVRLGLTVNALRNRLMRARRELDSCVRKRLRDVSILNRIPIEEQERSN